MKIIDFKALMLTTVSAVALPTAVMAEAAPSDASAAASAEVSEIVVTGSHLTVNGNSAPTPVTVVSAQQLAVNKPQLLSESLAEIPQFRGSLHTTSLTTPLSTSGAFANLRGLGYNRTLVLIDGRRLNATDLGGIVDINTLPSPLVQRVDVVTGGASAAYGSDAVAGVVNFILDTHFQGFKADINGGVSEIGDARSQKISLAAGHSFLDDRLHVIASYEHFKNDGILPGDERAWNLTGVNIIQNPTYPTDGRTAFLYRFGTRGTGLVPGGVILAGPLRGTRFGPGGVPRTYNFGSEVTASTEIGGDAELTARGGLLPPITNSTAFARAEFDVAPHIQVFAEGGYYANHTDFDISTFQAQGARAYTIFNDNAFLSNATRAAMGAANITSFALNSVQSDWATPSASSDTEGGRGAIGFKADIGRWNVNGYASTGQTRVLKTSYNNINQVRLYQAVDSVVSPTSGQVVCRSTLTNPNDGCVPLDVLGPGSASGAALNYIHGSSFQRSLINQQDAAINISGSPFEIWGNALQIAAGYEYRKLSAKADADGTSLNPISAAPGSKGFPASLVGVPAGWFVANQARLPKTSYDVNEVFLESQLPLLKDRPLVKSLEVNAAVRYADYSSTGGITSWKLGAVYSPTDELRFRGTLSRDVRAPTLTELHALPLAGQAAIFDPVKNTSTIVFQFTSGNPNLRPETSKSTVIGGVYQPNWLPGAQLSVDYYNIELTGAIGTVGGQVVLNQCFAGVASYCAFVNRSPDQSLSSINVVQLNLNSIKTDGIDFEASYVVPLDSWNVPGRLSLRALLSDLRHYTTTDPFGNSIETAGVNGGEASGLPRWQNSFSAEYALGPVTLNLRERYISSGKYSTSFTTEGKGSTSVDYNSVKSVAYTDLALRWSANDHVELYGNINNLLNQDPPQSPSRVGLQTTTINTNGALYDVIGRAYTAGIRLKY